MLVSLNACDWQVRVATSSDLSGIAQIITESFYSQNGLWGWAFPLFKIGIYEDLRYRLQTLMPHQTCLVAIHTSQSGNHQVLGTVELGVRFVHSWTNYNRLSPYVSNLAVDPRYRRYGLGSSLLTSCEQVCKGWGFQDIYLHVLEKNHQARKLYLKLGYEIYRVESSWQDFLFPSRQFLLHKRLS